MWSQPWSIFDAIMAAVSLLTGLLVAFAIYMVVAQFRLEAECRDLCYPLAGHHNVECYCDTRLVAPE